MARNDPADPLAALEHVLSAQQHDSIMRLIQVHEATGDMAALVSAEAQSAVYLDQAGPAVLPDALAARAMVLWTRYERLAVPGDLDEAADCLERSLALHERGAGDKSRIPMIRSDLAGIHLLRWQSLRSGDDLDTALRHLRKALDVTGESDPHYLDRIDRLGGILEARFRQYGDYESLQEALKRYREALGATEQGTAQFAGRASNLGLAYVLTGYDADKAVELTRHAVDLTRPAYPLHARFQSNLSVALVARHRQRGWAVDLDAARKASRAAVAFTPKRDSARAMRMLQLAEVAIEQYRIDPQPKHLKEVIRTARQVALVGRGTAFGSVALGLEGWADSVLALNHRRSPMRLRRAERNRAEAWRSPNLPTSQRIHYGKQWAAHAVVRSPQEALERFEEVSELLPRLASQRISRADQERALGEINGFVSDAAACAVAAGRPERAVELLEGGRGTLLSRVFNLRSDLDVLRGAHPRMADELEAAREALDSPNPRPGTDRHRLSRRWDELVEEVRALVGFEDFLRTPGWSSLARELRGLGPVVWINVSLLGSHALCLVAGELKVVDLPGLGPNEVQRRANAFRREVVSPMRDAALAVADTRRWLWEELAEPVLAELGLLEAREAPGDRGGGGGSDSDESYDDWPTVHWIPTRGLAFLPIHAAGGPVAVLDRVVSSYAPTARSLTVHAGGTNRGGRAPKALLVAAENAAPLPLLPGVVKEVRSLGKILPGSLTLTGERAVRREVLAALPSHDWAHFACHAVYPHGGSSTGGLMLHDANGRPLSIGDIAAKWSQGAELAFLSACDTAQSAPELADEAVHLAGAFQLAGYRQVVGTLWPVQDQAARSIAERFYKRAVQGESSAVALHGALRQMRDERPGEPAVWASHVLFGR
ncbi:CHAT domain-containing protein [Glycomyces buryatensis]|nr:CHAT domain-containing protein [Glycomyces buryatensis]